LDTKDDLSALRVTRFSQLEYDLKILTIILKDRTEYLSIKG